jgi:hypothetical protein
MLWRTGLVVVSVSLLAAACGDDSAQPDTTTESGRPDPTEGSSTSSTTSSTSSTTSTSTSSSTTSTSTTSTTTTTSPPVIQSDVRATYTPVATAPGSLLVHDRWTVFVVDPTADPVLAQVVLGPLDGLLVQAARLASDGSLVVELIDDVPIGEPITVHEIVQFGPDGSIIDLVEDAILYDVAVFGGVEQALVGEVWGGDVEQEANLVAVPLDGRPPIAFGTAFAPEYGVDSIDVVDEIAVVSAFADLTELVTYTDAQGTEIILPSPTDGLPYGGEPFVHLAVISPDGSEVAWVEGPENYPDESGVATWFGDWRVRSMDLVTGEETLSWPFEFPTDDPFGQVVTGLVHAGDALVISRGVVHDALLFDIELLVLDLTTEEPDLYELPISGVVAGVIA